MRWILVLVFCMTCNVAKADQQLWLFLLTGQSNMSGGGDVADWPVGLPLNGSRLWNFRLNTRAWQHPAKESLHTGGVGPGLAFADRLATLRPTLNVGTVPCAKGSSSIAQWQWSNDPASLYQTCRSLWLDALANCPAGFICKIAGILHSQGEFETVPRGGEPIWQTWQSQTRDMVANFRMDVGDADLPFVFFRLGHPSTSILTNRPYWSDVQTQQNRLSFDLPSSAMIPTGDIYMPPGQLHYRTQEQLIRGQRGADAMNDLLP